MRMKKMFFYVLLAGTIVSCCKEGTGGDAILVVSLKHHDKVIPSQANYLDTVFVKFNAKELPGTKPDDFDTYFTGTAGEDHVHLTGLKCGEYFLYGAGLDNGGGGSPYRVTGGMAVKIKYSDRKDEKNIDLAVTE